MQAPASLGVPSAPLRFEILRAFPEEDLCTCHLVELTGARQSDISNSLRVLREAGLVVPDKVVRYTYYRLDAQALAAAVQPLAPMCASSAEPTRRRACS